MFNKLREVKDKVAMAKKLMDLQKKVAEITVDGTGAHGKITVTVNGLQQMKSCTIDPSLTEMSKVESGVVEAVNDAHTKLQKVMAERMNELGGAGFAEEVGEMLKQG